MVSPRKNYPADYSIANGRLPDHIHTSILYGLSKLHLCIEGCGCMFVCVFVHSQCVFVYSHMYAHVQP